MTSRRRSRCRSRWRCSTTRDEGEETLSLSNVSAGRLTGGEATGTIKNRDPLPKALLARFGRTAAVHVVEHVEERIAVPRDPGLRAGSRGGSCGRGWRATSRSASSVSSANWAAGGNPAGELPRIFRRLDSLTAQPSAWSPCRRTSPRDRPRKRLSWLPLGLRGGHPGHVALGTWGPCHRGVKSSREVRLNPLADGARNGVRSCHRPCKPSRNRVSCTTHGVRTEHHASASPSPHRGRDAPLRRASASRRADGSSADEAGHMATAS